MDRVPNLSQQKLKTSFIHLVACESWLKFYNKMASERHQVTWLAWFFHIVHIKLCVGELWRPNPTYAFQPTCYNLRKNENNQIHNLILKFQEL